MELYIDRDALGRALSRIQRVVEKRSTQPVLANVLLHARDGALRVTATDTEVAYLGEVEANVQAGGEVAIEADALFRIVRKLPEPTVHLALGDGQRLRVTAGRASFTLNGLSAQEYPALPPFEARERATVRESDLRRAIEQTAFSIATEDVRWGINGAHVEKIEHPDGPRLRLVATDRHRLACAELPFQGEVAFPSRMLVPRKALGVLENLLDGDAEITLGFGDGAMQVRRDRDQFWFRLLDGEFPDYRAVVPEGGAHAVLIDRAELDATLDRVTILLSERSRPVRFAFAEDEVVVDVENVDRGAVREAVPAELDGEPITVGFNGRYLREVLRAAGGERIRLQLAHPLAPCLVTNPDSDAAFFVVMPMRLD